MLQEDPGEKQLQRILLGSKTRAPFLNGLGLRSSKALREDFFKNEQPWQQSNKPQELRTSTTTLLDAPKSQLPPSLSTKDLHKLYYQQV